MVEVVDGWLSQLYPKKPTWNEIADAVESIGHKNLADSIRDVYNTGQRLLYGSVCILMGHIVQRLRY